MTNNHAATDAPDDTALLTAKKVEQGIVTCDACPVLCRIRLGKTGACDRYGNVEGVLTRMDPFTLAARSPELVRFAGDDWSGNPIAAQGSVRHRHRGRHDLSRLQARAIHRRRRRSTGSTW